MEHIRADELVIEYVGDVVRPLIYDLGEKRYEKQVMLHFLWRGGWLQGLGAGG